MTRFFDNLKNEFWNCKVRLLFVITFIGGLVAHGYVMFAKHPNYDEFIAMFHYGQGYQLGRWFLAMMGNFIFRIDMLISLPWLNGLIFLLFLSAAAVLFIKPFHMNNLFLECLIALLFVTFPSVTATLSYMFTAPYYAFAILLSALAFYISTTYTWGFLAGIFLVCFSAGIYQAYFCLSAVFALFYFLRRVLEQEGKIKKILMVGGQQILMLLAGINLYMLVNKIILAHRNVELSDYRGLSTMGQISLNSLITALKRCYLVFGQYFYTDYLALFPYKALNYAIISGWVLFVLCVVFLIFKIKSSHLGRIILAAAAIGFIPVGINLIFIMCADSFDDIHMLMCHGAFMMYAAPLFFLDMVIRELDIKKWISVVLCSFIMFSLFLNIKYSNAVYLAYEIHYEQMYSFFQTLMTKIQTTEGYKDEYPVMFGGYYVFDQSLWELRYPDKTIGMYQTFEVANYRDMRANIFRFFLGYNYNELIPDEEILNSEEYRSMPAYPDFGSVRVINETVVVKFSD